MIHSLFSIPVAHYEIKNWRKNKERILNALPAFQEEHLESNGEQYTDFFHQDEQLLPAYADTVIAIIEPYLCLLYTSDAADE